ncbi:hypothetical protein HDU92_004245 [Lobulomyces angularis]|nr:hypothetical protein HDU92_004245 [Lobulomyces angularis]
MTKRFIVSALYDYVGNEERSLSFKRGDIIRVITQLESGWWDGVCKGQRGWFPSNYVTSTEIATDIKISSVELHSNSNSSATLISAVESNVSNNLISPFSDRSYQQYQKQLNEGTPTDTLDDISAVHQSSLTKDSLKSSSLDKYSLSVSSPSQTITPMSAISEQSFGMYSMKSPSSAAILKFDQNLPPNWAKKQNSDGKIYYQNLLTEHISWSLDNVHMENGELMKNNSSQPNQTSQNIERDEDVVSNKWNWNALSDDIVNAVHNLNLSAKSSRKENFVSQSLQIMESIKIMLYASGTFQKDTPLVSSHKILKTNHKHIMNALTKLGLSAKLASNTPCPVDAVQQMQQACHDVLLAVRHFVSAALEAEISINNLDGVDLSEVTNWQSDMSSYTSLMETNQDVSSFVELQQKQADADLIALYEKHTKSVVKTISLLVRLIRSNQCSSSSLIAEVRSVVTDVGNFLALVDEIPVDTLSHEVTVDFKVTRLALYNSISGLVMATQTATSPLSPSNALEQVVLSTGLVEKAVKDLFASTKFMIEEKEELDQLSDIKKEEAALIKPRRTVSLSSAIPPVITPMAEGELNNNTNKDLKLGHGQPQSAGPLTTPNGIFGDGETSSPVRSKIKKFFGEVPDSPISVGVVKQETVPPFLQYDYGPNDIIFNMEGKIKGGTLEGLIERLTPHDSNDSNYTTTFLLTYRSFTSSTEFFELLKKRYLITPDPFLSKDELQQWVEKKQTPIRMRVFNILKSWIENYSESTPEDLKVLSEMKDFATVMSHSIQFASQQLVKLVEKRILSLETNTPSKKIIKTSNICPLPILPKNLKKIKFLDIDPLEIARQLTILESKTFNKIQPMEFLKKAWSEKESDNSKNVKEVAKMSNLITSWVAETILLQSDLKQRAAHIKHFILIAEKCRTLNNFNTLMSIMAGLNSAPIHRLKRTFELLSSKTQTSLDQLQSLMSTTKNYSVYREALHASYPPSMPFLGLYLTDLTFIEDGNPDLLKPDNRLINFSKRSKTAEVIMEIQQYQRTHYNLTPVVEIQNFIINCLTESLDENKIYDLSLQLEPREREDEKIARLLSESGFL